MSPQEGFNGCYANLNLIRRVPHIPFSLAGREGMPKSIYPSEKRKEQLAHIIHFVFKSTIVYILSIAYKKILLSYFESNDV